MRADVLVTGIGGNVGQGALRIIRALPETVRLVGTNTRKLSPGNHLCDAVHLVPPARSSEFPAAFAKVCAAEGIDLVIPCTDDETVALARVPPPCPTVAGTDGETCETFHDKLVTADAFSAAGIPFAPAVLPGAYRGEFDRTVVKPRTGRGSRGLHLDPADPSAFDASYMVQRRMVGVEVTTAFYVTRQGKLHGMICLERELEHGATVRCRVAPEFEVALRPIVEAMVHTFAIRGCCNVQSIVADDGRAWPFEVNCRVSGTASIRHALGFEDVGCLMDEYLFDRPPRHLGPVRGTALRILTDVVYRDVEPDGIEGARTPHELF